MANFLRNREDFSSDCGMGAGQWAQDTAVPGPGCQGGLRRVLQDHNEALLRAY
jgi:hypothetical protein